MKYEREARVGVVFVIGLILLLIFTIAISQWDIFRAHYEYTIIFDSISGMRQYDEVQVSGLALGKVIRMERMPDNKIKVVVSLSEPVKFYKGYRISIESSSMIGGNYVYIYPGRQDKEKIDLSKETLEGKITISGLDELGRVLSDNKEDVRNLLQNFLTVMNKIKQGEGTVGKLIMDDSIYNNLKATSESLKKISQQIESGEGVLGRLISDTNLSQQLTQMSEAGNKIFGPVVSTQVIFGVESKYYAESELTATKLSLRIYPHPYRYFSLGATSLAFNKDGVVDFENKTKENKNQTFLKADVQLAYRLESNNHWFTFRPGLIEGKPGVGLDWEIPVTTTGLFPLALTIESRDAYNSVKDEDIDENLKGGLFRAYGTIKLSRYFNLYAGASRLFNDDAEFFGGISFSYPDQDIKNFIVLLGLSR